MPTGYTAEIYDGKPVTFSDFAMTCARAFGALVEMREDDANAPIPEFEPSPYYREALAKAEARLDDLRAMDTDQIADQSQAEHDKALTLWRERKAERTALTQRYQAMIHEVQHWRPPTKEHEGLKTFMLEQLTSALDFDCSGTYDSLPVQISPAEWRRKQIEKAERDIGYYADEWAKEIERTTQRNEWVRALRESLPESTRV